MKLRLTIPQASVNVVEYILHAHASFKANRGLQGLSRPQRLNLSTQLVELGLTRHFVKTGAELRRHPSHMRQEPTDLAHQHGQILRTDHNQSDNAYDQEIEDPAFRKHSRGSSSFHGPTRAARKTTVSGR